MSDEFDLNLDGLDGLDDLDKAIDDLTLDGTLSNDLTSQPADGSNLVDGFTIIDQTPTFLSKLMFGIGAAFGLGQEFKEQEFLNEEKPEQEQRSAKIRTLVRTVGCFLVEDKAENTSLRAVCEVCGNAAHHFDVYKVMNNVFRPTTHGAFTCVRCNHYQIIETTWR